MNARKIDKDGLLLCDIQAKTFELSIEKMNSSSEIFIRRYMHSDIAKKLDNGSLLETNLQASDILESVNEQYGTSNYGSVKYSNNEMFWIGYFYRYVSYTREQSTRFVMKIFPYKQLNKLYYVYHTQDLEWCISNLLELNGLTEDYFDNNYRLKAIIKSEMDQYH